MKEKGVYLGLGGNFPQSHLLLKEAVKLLSVQKEISDFRQSNFYRTAPHQMSTNEWFVNGVCSFQTTLSLHALFEITQGIEIQLGKVKKEKNESRPIDIDILFYGTDYFEDKELTIPHPSWKERLFVLIPLADLTLEITLQSKNGIEIFYVKELIDRLPDDALPLRISD